jgi:hypothetical protein
MIISYMDLSMNLIENLYDDDNIRPPDQSKSEILIDDNRSIFDKELEEAIYQSIQLYKTEVQKNEEYERKIMEEQKDEIEKRKKFVKPILFELNRIKKYDNKLNDILNIIEPILETYCALIIENYTVDSKTYDYIFSNLSKIRINIEFLKSIIQSE